MIEWTRFYYQLELNSYSNLQVSERKIHELVKAEKLGGYVECSALLGGEKVEEVFQASVKLSLIRLGVTNAENVGSDSKKETKKTIKDIFRLLF